MLIGRSKCSDPVFAHKRDGVMPNIAVGYGVVRMSRFPLLNELFGERAGDGATPRGLASKWRMWVIG